MLPVNIPVSEFYKSQLHTQVMLPMHWSSVNDNAAQDFTQHNLAILNLWSSKTEVTSHHLDTHEKQSADMARVEQKLDLIINLFQQVLANQSNNNLNLNTVLISVSGISWYIDDPQVQVDQTLLIELSLDTSQLPIYLYSKVIKLDSIHDRTLCTASFNEQNEQVHELMEKWIFNLHRREIANLRQK